MTSTPSHHEDKSTLNNTTRPIVVSEARSRVIILEEPQDEQHLLNKSDSVCSTTSSELYAVPYDDLSFETDTTNTHVSNQPKMIMFNLGSSSSSSKTPTSKKRDDSDCSLELTIHYQKINKEFSPGEVIQGYLRLNTPIHIDLEKAEVQLIGKERVFLTHEENIFMKKETNFLYLSMEPGNHTLEFSFAVDHALPLSFTNPHCSVDYYICARAECCTPSELKRLLTSTSVLTVKRGSHEIAQTPERDISKNLHTFQVIESESVSIEMHTEVDPSHTLSIILRGLSTFENINFKLREEITHKNSSVMQHQLIDVEPEVIEQKDDCIQIELGIPEHFSESTPNWMIENRLFHFRHFLQVIPTNASERHIPIFIHSFSQSLSTKSPKFNDEECSTPLLMMKTILSTPMHFSSPSENKRKPKLGHDIGSLFSQYNPSSPTHKAYINHKVTVHGRKLFSPAKHCGKSEKSFLNESSIEDINIQIEKTRKHVERLNEQLSLSCPPFKAEKDEFVAKYFSKLMGPASELRDFNDEFCFTPPKDSKTAGQSQRSPIERLTLAEALSVGCAEISFAQLGKYVGSFIYNPSSTNQLQALPHGQGTFFYSNGNTYSGQFVKGKKHGEGYLEFKDGSSYKGDFLDDLRCGYGVYQCKGYHYSGSWEFDKKKGHGVIVYSNGESYEGSFENNLPHGSGKYLFKDKSLYEGEFENGYPHGNGTLFYSDRISMYNGQWKCGRKSGKAHLILPNGSYEGDMEDDCKHGTGRYLYKNGDVYEGGFAHDKKHGQGVYFFAQGGYLKGTWHFSAKHGPALLCAQDGTLYEEVWDNDILVSKALAHK
ncbi:hypothetical protein C9374_003457 [Naegleria lovaniensis]|uniref:Uncharacterized protein n=1 Tax=Naegleria lovaniensis TaxID=51637 RepID=A0AA88GMX5_NAELO|nr:uncharacterized protein C9374_003457 [Naegleria lovaniensis]KAG2385642.1 hypothetical protein C9374_003457 [Naegleria lovaniensis]